MGSTEQEQAEAMKRYIREVFIPEYAKNFNKGLSEADIKFYGKIHFDRNRSDNELNIHCHLIVSRKDQANKKKLSPLTNHKDTKNGTVSGGFDRVNLFQKVEQGFDRLFNYNRQQTESFDYHNTMKNGSISEQSKLQEQEIQSSERKIDAKLNSNQEISLSINLENNKSNNLTFNANNKINKKQNNPHQYINQNNILSSDSFIPFSLFEVESPPVPVIPEKQKSSFKKKKRRKL